MLTSVPVPPPAPLPKEGEAPPPEQPTTIAGLLGNLFGGNQAVAKPATAAEPESEPVALRGSEETAKPQPAVVRTATAPAPVVPRAKPQPAPKAVAAAPKPQPAPKAVASAPAPRSQVARTEKPETQGANPAARFAPPIRRRRSRAANNGLLAGAAPVVPVGTFDSRWSAFR